MQPPEKERYMGKLSLSDELSIERTKLANDRTLLSFIRTSLYFSVAGLTITALTSFTLDWLVAILFFVAAAIVFFTGLARYLNLRRKLKTGAFNNQLFHVMLNDEE